jgi:uncharacterized protein
LIRDIVWEWVGRAGLEHLRVAQGEDGVCAEGRVVVAAEQGVACLSYRVECDAAWRFRAAAIEIGGAAHAITPGAAGWAVDGAPRPDLACCADIDIRLTPFTNTLPIRRLAWAEGEAVRLDIAYVHLPDFSVSRVAQEYTALGGGRFRYRSLATGFTAELATDADGIVRDYPGVWRRRT